MFMTFHKYPLISAVSLYIESLHQFSDGCMQHLLISVEAVLCHTLSVEAVLIKFPFYQYHLINISRTIWLLTSILERKIFNILSSVWYFVLQAHHVGNYSIFQWLLTLINVLLLCCLWPSQLSSLYLPICDMCQTAVPLS